VMEGLNREIGGLDRVNQRSKIGMGDVSPPCLLNYDYYDKM